MPQNKKSPNGNMLDNIFIAFSLVTQLYIFSLVISVGSPRSFGTNPFPRPNYKQPKHYPNIIRATNIDNKYQTDMPATFMDKNTRL